MDIAAEAVSIWLCKSVTILVAQLVILSFFIVQQTDQDRAIVTDLTDAPDVIDPDREKEIIGTGVVIETAKESARKKGEFHLTPLTLIRMCEQRVRILPKKDFRLFAFQVLR